MQIGENELSSELTGLNKGEAEHKKKLLIGGMVAAIILIILITIIIIVSTSGKSENEEEPDYSKLTKLGEINCIFDVNSITQPTEILGNEFVKNSKFNIIIDEKSIKYSKEYLFSKTGEQNVQFIIYEDFNMDNMFKNLNNLLSVNMISDKNVKITSMISSFENCNSLETLIIKGFDTTNVKSMHKFLYESYGEKIDFTKIEIDTKNVEDMSYMLSNTRIENLDLKNINTENVYNMSHMFYRSFSLYNLDVSKFNTNKEKDMTYLFSECESFIGLDVSNFKTNSVIKMSGMFREMISLSK